jgi:hypothetical protein
MDSATIRDAGQREAAFAADFTARLAALTDINDVLPMQRELGKAIRERAIGPDVLKDLQGECSTRGWELNPITREEALSPGARWETTLAWADRVLAVMPFPGACHTDDEIDATAIRRANELPPMSPVAAMKIVAFIATGPPSERDAAAGA